MLPSICSLRTNSIASCRVQSILRYLLNPALAISLVKSSSISGGMFLDYPDLLIVQFAY